MIHVRNSRYLSRDGQNVPSKNGVLQQGGCVSGVPRYSLTILCNLNDWGGGGGGGGGARKALSNSYS